MRRTRLSTTLVAAAAVTFGLVSPVAMAEEATDTSAPTSTATETPAEGDGTGEGEDTGNAGDSGSPEDPEANGDSDSGDQTGGDSDGKDEEPDTMFGSSVETTAKFKEVMSWVSVVGALLAGIVQATVMLAQINPAILNPLKDLLKQAGVKF